MIYKKKIAILGGGAAGWLTALFLQKTWHNIDITVIEDPSNPPIIAGESGSANISSLLDYLEINLDDWIINATAMPKIGGKFIDWREKGTEFSHVIINSHSYYEYHHASPVLPQYYEFLSLAIVNDIPISKTMFSGLLSAQNKVPFRSDTRRFTEQIMWHFDSRANAAYLKKIGLGRGITLLEKKFVNANVSPVDTIEQLNFDDGNNLKADWYFDCSGFSRLLLVNTLHEPLTDYSKYFPASSVVAWWDKPEYVPYTKITAMDAGWSWNINLVERSGNGYVYDSSIITVDQAIDEAEKKFGQKIDPIAKLNFTPCSVEKVWRGNVIAIGLSTGFIEPLESNGLAAVAAQLYHLVDCWSPNSNSVVDGGSSVYNKIIKNIINNTVDFLNIHYRGARVDTKFWKKIKSSEFITEGAANILEQWKYGILHNSDYYSAYSIESFMVVGQGLGLINAEELNNKLIARRPDIHTIFKMCFNNMLDRFEFESKNCLTVDQVKNHYHKGS